MLAKPMVASVEIWHGGTFVEGTHAIDIVLPRVLKIEEAEQSTLGKDNNPSFFSNYERQRPIKHFVDPEVKYYISRQSYQRKLKTRTLN